MAPPEREILRAAELYSADLLSRYGYVRDGDLTLTRRRSVLVTPTEQPRPGEIRGALFGADGRLIPSSQRHDPDADRPTDPAREPDNLRGSARRIPRAIYGGRLFQILGHFLFESLARLWPLAGLQTEASLGRPGEPDPTVIFHPTPGFDRRTFAGSRLFLEILKALGIRFADVVVADHAIVVDTLDDPAPLSVYHASLHPMMAALLDRVAERIAPDRRWTRLRPRAVPSRIYLSRSRWPAGARVRNEDELEAILVSLGYAIVHPQLLAPRRLIGCLRNAETVASLDGSQAHLAAFCRPGTRLLVLDTRPVPTQSAITHLRQLEALHLPLFDHPELWDAGSLRVRPEMFGKVLESWTSGAG